MRSGKGSTSLLFVGEIWFAKVGPDGVAALALEHLIKMAAQARVLRVALESSEA